MPRRTSWRICVFPSFGHSTRCVRNPQTILGLLCVPLRGTQTTDGEMPSLCQTKHNRAKPMSERPSALFSIADGSEFRFARFYIVCEAVPLGAPESPLIVCGFAGHTLWKVQTWKDTEFDVQRGMEEIFGFSSKELLPLVAFWNFIFSNILVIKRIPVRCKA